MKESKVFLLDEPSSDLDNETTDHVLEEFMNIAHKANQQIIMVTHDKEVSDKFAEEIINMDQYSKQVHHGGDSHRK